MFSAQRNGDKDVAELQLLTTPEEEAEETDPVTLAADNWRDFDIEITKIEQLLEKED